ncbi:MAG: metal-dependent transcriptional regulator [Chloroflexota bacterium]|nr:metal-dependent transcriptional regulator [Chloroflexota bacterium]
MKKQQTASMEDYLEAIAMLRQGEQPVRVSQISKALGVKMPSVTNALNKLAEDGLVHHERYGYVGLTTEGVRIAEDVFHRHETIRLFLSEVLCIDADTATDEACRIEHTLSATTVQRLEKFVEFASICPYGRPGWLESLRYYFKHGEHPPNGCPSKCKGHK